MSPAYDWRQLAELHRPTGPDAIGAEIRRLRAQGLKPHDIAEALRIGVSAVVQALAENGATA
jgi:hypothetical protein